MSMIVANFEKRSISTAGVSFFCLFGRDGIAENKVEGDWKTPIGTFPIRAIYYRADRMEKPISAYECIPIKENDGWCDDVYSDNYNTIITLPSAESYENLWRHDELYDIIIVLGYNDNPVVKGAGSAIFIHIAKDGMQHTKGCLALQKNDLLLLISKIDTKTSISIN